MASPASLPVMDAALAHVGQLTAKPTPCCDVGSPRIDTIILKDASKRKRVNRNAKLKQCKLDARREQWLSQVNIKHIKADQEPETHDEESKDYPGDVVHTEEHPALEQTESRHSTLGARERIETVSQRSHVRIKRPEDCDKDSSTNGSLGTGESSSSTNSCMSDCSEADSSPKSYGDISPKSKVTRRGRDCRGRRGMPVGNELDKVSCDTERKCVGGKEVGNLENCSNTSGSTVYENGFDESSQGLDSEDDWEAAADALDLKPPREKVPNPHQSAEAAREDERVGLHSVAVFPVREICGDLKRECRSIRSQQTEMVRSCSGKAWRPDDICRPTSLPSLTKQQSLPAHVGCQQQRSPVQKDTRDPPPFPQQCPICTEELDSTESVFDPCSCGFRLCLFCYHRIASEDGRCPGCRKFYTTDMPPKPDMSCTLRGPV